jgi:hypothetical protein
MSQIIGQDDVDHTIKFLRVARGALTLQLFHVVYTLPFNGAG